MPGSTGEAADKFNRTLSTLREFKDWQWNEANALTDIVNTITLTFSKVVITILYLDSWRRFLEKAQTKLSKCGWRSGYEKWTKSSNTHHALKHKSRNREEPCVIWWRKDKWWRWENGSSTTQQDCQSFPSRMGSLLQEMGICRQVLRTTATGSEMFIQKFSLGEIRVMISSRRPSQRRVW